ncbi:tyrosine-protein phosphatase [Flagellimonas aequoris]|uniref:protein-tyrosine-phosphatase n=1 Tax=Flagellimonas aequoris TaxID=2306997 RepID=A0A418NCP4_9FLAO|nr:CpsB/CapC family capsule biosynthesis tyrosine phosphatase [Allomuricauda aequoris]RIV74375.1 histidinol phosphatase [Allomuricauda aequoris]TXK08497.1 histidinol phosphatase [Allomuricauda aequoris]
MFSFFQKKVYLADYLHGLVDIHNHILPGIDDGAKSVEDSIGLINGFAELGVKSFICTPHIMHNHYDNTPATIKKSYQHLEAELEKRGITDVSLDIAAEHMIDDNFENILKDQQVMPLHKEYLLVEMSFLQPSFNFEMAIDEVARQQYFPILAHPERYMYFHQKYGKYPSMKSNGIMFQLNLLSLASESYGTSITKMAEKLLGDGLIDFVGTDIHNTRQLSLLKEIKLSNKVLNQLLPVIENTIQTFY